MGCSSSYNRLLQRNNPLDCRNHTVSSFCYSHNHGHLSAFLVGEWADKDLRPENLVIKSDFVCHLVPTDKMTLRFSFVSINQSINGCSSHIPFHNFLIDKFLLEEASGHKSNERIAPLGTGGGSTKRQSSRKFKRKDANRGDGDQRRGRPGSEDDEQAIGPLAALIANPERSWHYVIAL